MKIHEDGQGTLEGSRQIAYGVKAAKIAGSREAAERVAALGMRMSEAIYKNTVAKIPGSDAMSVRSSGADSLAGGYQVTSEPTVAQVIRDREMLTAEITIEQPDADLVLSGLHKIGEMGLFSAMRHGVRRGFARDMAQQATNPQLIGIGGPEL